MLNKVLPYLSSENIHVKLNATVGDPSSINLERLPELIAESSTVMNDEYSCILSNTQTSNNADYGIDCHRE